MKVTLLMATTLNGYIAGLDDDTEWVNDIDSLNQTIAKFGIVIMGKRTYNECMKYDDFPYEGALNIVMTSDEKLIALSTDNAIFTDKNPIEVLKLAEEKGLKEVLLIGGGRLNGSFIKDNLIDEILIDVHPVIKANGIRLFEEEFADVNLSLLKVKELGEGMVQLHYSVSR